MIKSILTPIFIISFALQTWAGPMGTPPDPEYVEILRRIETFSKQNAPLFTLEELKKGPPTVEETRLATPEELALAKESHQKYDLKRAVKNPEIMKDLPADYVKAKTKSKFWANTIRGIAGLYIAMTIVALAAVYLKSSSSPAALAEVKEHGKDPTFHLSIIGGTVASYWLFNRAGIKEELLAEANMYKGNSAAQSRLKSLLKSSVRFGGAFFAMGVAVSALGEILNDKNFLTCIGLEGPASKSNGACDRFSTFWFKSWNGAMKMLPAAGQLLESGLVAYGLVSIAGIGISRLGVATGIHALARASSITGLPGVIVTALVFVAIDPIVRSVFDVEQWGKEYVAASRSLVTHELGATIRESQRLIYNNWNSVRKNEWKRYSPEPNLPIPKVDLSLLLKNYQSKMGEWRGVLLTPTFKSYKQWNFISDTYSAQYKATYKGYRNATSEVAGYWKEKLEKPNEEPKVSRNWISSQGILNYSKIRASEVLSELEKIKSLGGSDTGSKMFKELNEFLRTRDLNWEPNVGKIQTYNNTGLHLLASMVCGPEIMKDEPLVLESIIDETKFLPPKITMITNRGNDICEQASYQQHINGFTFPDDSNKRGLTTYLLERTRPDVVDKSTGTSHFDTWWSNNVLPSVNKTYEEFRDRYIKVLKNTYIPALTNTDYVCFDEELANKQDRDDLPFSADLEDKVVRKGQCPPTSTQVSRGIFNSVNDEINLYLRILKDIYVTKNGKEKAPIFTKAGQKFLGNLIKYENKMTSNLTAVLDIRQNDTADDFLVDHWENVTGAYKEFKLVMGYRIAPVDPSDIKFISKEGPFNVTDDGLITPESKTYADEITIQLVDQIDKLLNLPADLSEIITFLNPR